MNWFKKIFGCKCNKSFVDQLIELREIDSTAILNDMHIIRGSSDIEVRRVASLSGEDELTVHIGDQVDRLPQFVIDVLKKPSVYKASDDTDSIKGLKREFIDSQKKILDLDNNVDKKVLFNLCSDMENVLENAYRVIDGIPKLEVDFNGFKVGDFVKWKFCGKDYFVFIIKLTEKEIELACGEHHFIHTCVNATLRETLEMKATKLF